MDCQLCYRHKAILSLCYITNNNKKKVIRLCLECAIKKGIISKDGESSSIDINTLILSGLRLFKNKRKALKNRVCPKCNTELKQILDNQKCGCSICYYIFKNSLKRKIEEISGFSQHKGKIPKQLFIYKTYLFDIWSLKEKLKNAVIKEDYESAAILRDSIKRLKDKSWQIQ